jgi:uncharacterized alkaline shock family protein YloU
MTNPTADKTGAVRSRSESEPSASAESIVPRADASVLLTNQGKTTIADTVVEKIAALAAREIPGVYNLGGGMTRTFGSVRERIPGARASTGQGVSVEVGERQTAVDLVVVVEYGVEIGELTRAIRRNVIGSIERMTALQVMEVNIAVDDVHIEGEPEPKEPRVA